MSEASTVQVDQFAEETVSELIDWLDLEEGNEWQAAARSIYIRYYEWLFRRLYTSLKNSGYIEDIILKTFSKAIHSISKFKRVEGEDPDDTRARFEGWLLKISRNLVSDYYCKPDPSETREAAFWNRVAVDVATPTAESPPSREVEAARDTLNELTEREQIVLQAWMQHCSDISNPQSKLPRSVLDELCECLNTTKANIRTIRKRAIARFKTKLQDKGIYI